MGMQVIHRYLAYSALWASKWCTASSHIWHYGQAGDTQQLHIQCKMGKQVNGDSR